MKRCVFCRLVLTAAIGAVGVLVVMGACSPQVYEGDKPGGAGGNTGTVSVHVTRLGPGLARAVERPAGGIETAALLIADRVELWLYRDGTRQETLVLDLEASTQAPGDAYETEWNVRAASGYTLEARIFNNDVSSDVPVLLGTSDTFNVTAGGVTDVAVLPTPDGVGTEGPQPIAPTSIVPNSGEEEVSLDSSFSTGESLYDWGGEHWFVIDLSAVDPLPAVSVTADPDSDSAVYMAAYDGDGRFITETISGALIDGTAAYWAPGTPALFAVLTPGEKYFVGLVTISEGDSSIESSVSVSADGTADDEWEENDTVAQAETIETATLVSGIDLDPTDDGDLSGGDWYAFTPDESEAGSVEIVLTFDADESNLDLYLYSWSGSGNPTLIESSTGTETSGPGDPETEEELITAPLTAGQTYYIWVRAAGTPIGAEYTLEWAGQGTISIGIE
ncbi:MAG: hypothetical protein ACOCXE_02175 [Spirochaetota bacterium]